MKIPPIEVIASWPKPNYTNPESRAPIGRVVGSILLILVTIILSIRLYSRKRLTKGLGLDDILICLAYIPAAAFTILGIVTQEEFQWGRHIWDVEPRFYRPNLILTLVHLFLFDLTTSLTKLSMLAMVRRLTAASYNKFENKIVLALAALITVNCFIFITVETFQCRPVSYGWTLHPSPSPNCIDEESHIFSAGIINTATDFAVVLLPIRTALRIQLSPRQRVVVASLFGIGLVASAVGIARTVFTWLMLNSADYDSTWRSWYVWLTSLIELHLGIICASVPATKPFFTAYTKKKRRQTFSSSRTTHIPPLAPYASGDEDDEQHGLRMLPSPPSTAKNTSSFRGSSISFSDTTTLSPHQSRQVYPSSQGPSRQSQ